MSWLDRLKAADSDLCHGQPSQPSHNKLGSCDSVVASNLSVLGGTVGTVGRGASTEIAPAADAPAHLWRAWFDGQIELIDADLAAERTSLDRELRTLQRQRRRRLTQEEQRRASWARGYSADLTPRPDTPEAACACGERVWYQLRGDTAWRCRTCEAPDARWRVRWFIL